MATWIGPRPTEWQPILYWCFACGNMYLVLGDGTDLDDVCFRCYPNMEDK
jgi:hypothetical protein